MCVCVCFCRQVEGGKDYLEHLRFCTKLMASDSGPLGGCRGRAGVPMFGNVVFGGFKGESSSLTRTHALREAKSTQCSD